MNKRLVVVDCFASLAMTVYTDSSLRRPKACGNLGMGYNYSFIDFFSFSVNDKKSVVYGLLRFARNDEGGG